MGLPHNDVTKCVQLGVRHTDEEIQIGADRAPAAAGGGGNREWEDHATSLQGSRGHGTGVIPLEKRVRRPEAEGRSACLEDK
jgi:hypothetical protein